MTSIYERAARSKLRFESPVGELTTEQLFDLPLTSSKDTKPNLDSIARAVNRELKDIVDGGFVDAKPDPRKKLLELRLEILVDVIQSRQAEKAAAEAREVKLQRVQKLKDLLATKDNEELASKSRADIEAELAKLQQEAA